MKHFKTIVIPEKTKEILNKITCDICNSEIITEDKDRFSNNEINVSCKIGRCYPDDCYGDKISFDICPDCFKNKLIPFLNSLGAEGTEESW